LQVIIFLQICKKNEIKSLFFIVRGAGKQKNWGEIGNKHNFIQETVKANSSQNENRSQSYDHELQRQRCKNLQRNE
jgi:hypothetical protein